MSAPWFRVPAWCHSMHDEANAARARAWVYLLGAWHAGDDPSTREVRRVTGFGQGRADGLVATVAEWAIANGAAIPAKVAEQYRSGNGAVPERQDADTVGIVGAHRSGIGAASEQDRSVSRARVPSLEKRADRREEKDTQEAPAPAVAPSAPTPKPTPKPDPTDTLHAVYRGHRPRTAATPTPDTRKALRRILAECGDDLDTAALYLAWTFTSQDGHAKQLRGEAPWPGGSVQARCDVVSLSRNIPPRLAAAQTWEARGRRDAPLALFAHPTASTQTGPSRAMTSALILARIAQNATDQES